MVDPDEHEIGALESAGETAGEYLDSLGITDLAQMSQEQWMTFIECVVTGYQDALTVALAGNNE